MRLLESLAYGTLLMLALLLAMLAPLPEQPVPEDAGECELGLVWFTCGLCEEYVD